MSLDERIGIYNRRIVIYKNAIRQTRWAQSELTSAVGEPVILPQQVRALTYLLGYKDSKYVEGADGPTGVSAETYRKDIKTKIPEEAKIKPSDYGRPKRHYGDIAFKTKAVKTALRQLGEEGKLSYNDADFERAINLV